MKNLFDLSGRVAVVTGSSKGIGKSIASQLALHGAKVVVSSRRQESCDAVASEINQSLPKGSGSALGIACHVGKKSDLENLVNGTKKRLGKIDILVSNAAVNPFYGSMLEISDMAYEKVLDSNVKSKSLSKFFSLANSFILLNNDAKYLPGGTKIPFLPPALPSSPYGNIPGIPIACRVIAGVLSLIHI